MNLMDKHLQVQLTFLIILKKQPLINLLIVILKEVISVYLQIKKKILLYISLPIKITLQINLELI